MKKLYIVALLSMSLHYMNAGPLNDPMIAMIDGSMLDGTKVRNIISFLVELRQLLYGKKNSTTGLYEGIIPINGKCYSIHELASIQNECDQQDCEESHCDCPVKRDELVQALIQAKIIFNKAHAVSQKDSKGTKQMSQRLIDLWSKANNRTNSYLIIWSYLPEHKEQESFNESITSFINFEFFLEDLISFLKDLVASCPKAYQQYKESLKKDGYRIRS